MSVDLVCPQCGHVHRIVTVFCAKCGAKMGAPEMRVRRERTSLAGALGTVVRWLVALALLAGVVLIAWPVPVPATTPEPALDRAFVARVDRMQAAIETGQVTAEVFTQAEVNSFLASRIAQTDGVGRAEGLRLALHALHLRVGERGVTFAMLAGHGPLRVSYEVTGVPYVAADGFHFRLHTARLGHLPLPGRGAQWVRGKLLQVVSGLEREREVLQHLSRCDLAEGRFRLVTAPSAP